MSNFPNSLDDDTTLVPINDNLSELGGLSINQLRDAVVNIEMNIGLGAAGTTPSIAARLGLLINPDGTPNSSTITSLGLVTLPITQDQISNNAGIPESKLQLNFPTLTLYNYIRDLSKDVNLALGWISVTGSKLEPHLIGAIYRHQMSDIDVSENPAHYLENVFRAQRDNTNSYSLVNDINNELLAHQWADGSPFGALQNVTTNDGSTYPSYYSHVASAIFLDTSSFVTISQTANDLQLFADFIDSSSIFLLGTRIQNLYTNGISRVSTSSSLLIDGYGQAVVPVTPVITFLNGMGNSSSPVDSINDGDDIVQFMPTNTSNNVFASQFAAVNVGDIIRVNYGTVEVAFIVQEKRYNQNGGNAVYIVRINGKNLAYNATTATARIDRSLINTNKYGVLAMAPAFIPGVPLGEPSLIIGNPRGAQALGNGFDASQLNSTHYLLYLGLYPDGIPADGYSILPAIDITGNAGATPGSYTLDSVVQTANLAFRQPGFNYRFIAFEYQGNFGIMLADPYNNASFSIFNGVVNSVGGYDPTATAIAFPNNVVDVFTDGYAAAVDPLGFGLGGANIASPPYQSSYTVGSASLPTQLFVPLKRNNYYVNGVEKEEMAPDGYQVTDTYGDGYWVATIDGYNIVPGVRIEKTYSIPYDLSTTQLKTGKTIVIQSLDGYGTFPLDFGRFIIEDINFNCCPNSTTTITVYDSVHAQGMSPVPGTLLNGQVAIYFSSDSVSFNAESATDFAAVNFPFKRHFEVYIDQNAHTFTHERGRMNISGVNQLINPPSVGGVTLASTVSLSNFDLVAISPKLRGYPFGNGVTKITLNILNYNSVTGAYSGYLCSSLVNNLGPFTIGKQGEVTRFYDETNIDYIDINLSAGASVPNITSPQQIDIQLFPTLALDEQVMILGSCQLNDTVQQLTYLTDRRQFGNVSEAQLTTSALDYIAAPTRLLQENGIIRGFDIVSSPTGVAPFSSEIVMNGGVAVVNGNIVQVNNRTISVPVVYEVIGTGHTINNSITWFICVNEDGEYEFIANTDFNPSSPIAATYVANSLDENRIFYVANPNNSLATYYPVRATYLSDLVQNQKDVVLVGIITSTVTLQDSIYAITMATPTINIDARRFITNGYGGLIDPFVLGPQGSFRNFTSLNNWLGQLANNNSTIDGYNDVGQTVKVVGNTTVSSTYILDYLSQVTFEGVGGSITVINDIGFALGSNVAFKNIKVNYLYDPVASGDPNYSDGYLSNPFKAAFYASAGDGYGMLAVSGQLQNITFENCLFTSPNQNRFAFLGFNIVSSLSMMQNIKIVDNKFQTTFNGDDRLAVVTFVGPTVQQSPTVDAPNGPNLNNCLISNNLCNKNQLILISAPYVQGNTPPVEELIAASNLKIVGNTCGAINVLVKRNVTTQIIDDVYNFMQSSGTIISGNTCPFIYSGYANGNICDGYGSRPFFVHGGGPVPLPASATPPIYTGYMLISNNVCSYIQTGRQVSYEDPLEGTSPLIIVNNQLQAYPNINYLTPYYDGQTTQLIAILVDEVSVV